MIFHGSKFDFLRQKCTKIRSKIACKMAWLNFAAKTLQDASKTLTRRLKKLSDLPQDAPHTPQDASKTPPRRPQDAPRRLQDEILVGFGSRIGVKLAPKSYPEVNLC